jgi:hypothetical protein
MALGRYDQRKNYEEAENNAMRRKAGRNLIGAQCTTINGEWKIENGELTKVKHARSKIHGE